jgi:hypothetical protein
MGHLDNTVFIALPDEVIAKILSELDSEQILMSRKISKRFNNICKQHRRILFDRFLTNKGFTISEYNPEIICKALDFSTRVVSYCKEKIFLYKDGSIFKMVCKKDGMSSSLVSDLLKNMISVACSHNFIYFLDSFGRVYKCDNCLTNITLVENIQNIVQIKDGWKQVYFLDVYGNVYEGGNKIPILGNINKIFSHKDSFVFLDGRQDLYAIGRNIFNKFHIDEIFVKNVTKIPFKNIKDVFIEATYMITIDNNNFIIMDNKTSYYLGENISKISIMSDIYLLRKDNTLTILDKEQQQKRYFENVRDFADNLYILIILLNTGEVKIYVRDDTYPDDGITLQLKGEVILLNSRFLSIDKEIYYIYPIKGTIKLIRMT